MPKRGRNHSLDGRNVRGRHRLQVAAARNAQPEDNAEEGDHNFAAAAMNFPPLINSEDDADEGDHDIAEQEGNSDEADHYIAQEEHNALKKESF